MHMSVEAPNVTQAAVPAHFESQEQQEVDENGSSKRQKSRHRASVACATCRERRIRVGRCFERPVQHETDNRSVSCLRVTPSVFNASELERNASSRMTMNEDGPSPEHI